jgi:hypothetical protein
MHEHGRLDGLGQHRVPVLVSFALVNQDFPLLEIEILDAQTQTCAQAQAAAVQHLTDGSAHWC